ncbi:CAAX amino terminal protease family protein [Abeliophyllum distichum]|uniref:CAAX amino terminal protease family protein n=1 Tax=Abeliophyllum distichum TaxID=126358 RepID=A0ABD1R9Y6_9LAMI
MEKLASLAVNGEFSTGGYAELKGDQHRVHTEQTSRKENKADEGAANGQVQFACPFCVKKCHVDVASSADMELATLAMALPFSPLIPAVKLQVAPTRGFCTICCYKNNSRQESDKKEAGLNWPILKRWDVPWNWQTISFDIACMRIENILSYQSCSFVLTGLIEAAAIPYTGIKIEELSLDEKAEILFVDQSIATAVVLGVLYSLTKSFSPLPNDIYRYDLREPFNLQKGWLLWAGIGLGGALGAIALTGVVMSFVSGETPQRETDALVRLLPLIGSSSISTACLVGITGVLAPILEETVFRGFFMVSLTKWLPNATCCAYQCCCICICTSHSWRISSAVRSRDCFGIFICSNPQPPNPNHDSCLLELWSYLASHLPSAPRI